MLDSGRTKILGFTFTSVLWSTQPGKLGNNILWVPLSDGSTVILPLTTWLSWVQRKFFLGTLPWYRKMWSSSHRIHTLLVERVPIRLRDNGWWTFNTHTQICMFIYTHTQCKHDYRILILLTVLYTQLANVTPNNLGVTVNLFQYFFFSEEGLKYCLNEDPGMCYVYVCVCVRAHMCTHTCKIFLSSLCFNEISSLLFNFVHASSWPYLDVHTWLW